jgi:hypothetical protein
LALPVHRDQVIAVIEHDRINEASQLGLQVVQVAKARPIVVPRMDDERRLAYSGNLLNDALD